MCVIFTGLSRSAQALIYNRILENLASIEHSNTVSTCVTSVPVNSLLKPSFFIKVFKPG
jgi:hypothetical protein